MGLLFIRSSGMHLCSAGGNCRSFQALEPQPDISSAIDALRPEGLVFLGELNPNPISCLSRLRTIRKYAGVKAAIVRSENEISSAEHLTECLRHAFWRFQGLLECEEHAGNGAARKLLIDLRARELCVSGKAVMLGPMEFRLLVFFLRYPDVFF